MENDDLTIYPVQDDPNRPQYRKVHDNLLKPPFRMAIVGASKSGKSNYLMIIILTKLLIIRKNWEMKDLRL